MSTNDAPPAGGVEPSDSEAAGALQPELAVLQMLREGAALSSDGDLAAAAQRYAEAADAASEMQDPAGYGRAMAQLAALEESRDSIERAFNCNRRAQEVFLEIGDGAGLVQTFRVDGFLHLRTGDFTAAATSFGKAVALALQHDGGMALATLDQMVPVARHLVESDELPALLPLGASLKAAVESAESVQSPELRGFSELAATVGGTLAPLAVLAEEPELAAEQRRKLAARATHQAWMIDALTRKRWALAELVKETLQTKLNFHEDLD